MPTCGDQILDDGEVCDAGLAGDSVCSDQCKVIEIPDLGGCCSTGGGPGGSIALGALVGIALYGRRRRRRSER